MRRKWILFLLQLLERTKRTWKWCGRSRTYVLQRGYPRVHNWAEERLWGAFQKKCQEVPPPQRKEVKELIELLKAEGESSLLI